ncbi:hypothetical protein EBQ81_05690 [bacterium]|nr:hypothetical protein [bacterium]
MGNEYDDDAKWYTGHGSDDPNGDLMNTNLDDLDDLPEASDDDLPDGHPSKAGKKTPDGDELAKAELGAGNNNSSGSTLPGEGSPFNYNPGGGKTKELQKKIVGFMQKKSTLYGGGAIAAGGIFGIASIITLTGPNVIINHYSDIITNKISQLQNSHSLKYRKKHIGVKNMFSKDSRMGGRVIADLENKGYKFTYDTDGKTVKSMKTPRGATLANEAIGDHISDYMESRHPIKSARWKTARTEALYKKFGISRSPVTAITGSVDDADTAINKAMAKNILTDVVDEDIAPGKAPPGETEAEKTAREAQEKTIKESVLDTNTEAKAARKELIETGRKVSLLESVSGVFKKAAPDIADASTAEVLELAKEGAKGSIGSRVFNGAKGILNPTDILDKTCTLKNRLRMSVMVARNYRAVSMLKYAAVIWAVADDTRQGKGSTEARNAFMQRITGLDNKGNGIADTQAYAFATKGTYSKSRNKATKNRIGVDGTLNGVMAGIQDTTDKIPGLSKTNCGVIQNPAFQIGSTVLITFASIFTGGGAGASIAAARTAIEAGVGAAIKTAIRQVITKSLIKQIALSAVIDLSFEGIMILTQYYIEQAMALNFTGQEKGGDFSNATIAGGSTANKQRSLQAGMVPVTGEQYAAIHKTYLAEKKDELKSKSFYARIFDTKNEDSLAYGLKNDIIFKNTTPGRGIENASSFIAKAMNPTQFVATAAQSFDAKTYAATEDEVSYETYAFETGNLSGTDVAVDFSGNPIVVLRDDIAGIDPTTNIDDLVAAGDIDATTLQPTSERFKKHIENCVENMDILSQVEFEDTSITEHDCLAKLAITIKFKAHLAYLDMLDGVSAEFEPSAISGGDSSNVVVGYPNNGSLPPTLVSGPDTSNIPCTAGTDGGVQDGYSGGTPSKIRVCNISGFVVNSQISSQVNNMFTAASKVGLSFVAKGFSGAFRNMDSQIATYNNWCDANNIAGSKPPFPKPPGATIKCPGGGAPGYSNHQMGLALDLGCNGTPIPKAYVLASLNECFKWLQANAGNYGLFELGMGKLTTRVGGGYEGWHWSVNGN